jgi:hypothetical protein
VQAAAKRAVQRTADIAAEHLGVRGRASQDGNDRSSAESLTRLHGHPPVVTAAKFAVLAMNTTRRSDFFHAWGQALA